jgi:hypothetical protein
MEGGSRVKPGMTNKGRPLPTPEATMLLELAKKRAIVAASGSKRAPATF